MSVEVGLRPEPPDRALVALVDPTDQEVPSLFERDDTASTTLYGRADGRRWFPGDAETEVQKVHTWADVLAYAAELGFKVVRLYREDDPAITVHAEAGAER